MKIISIKVLSITSTIPLARLFIFHKEDGPARIWAEPHKNNDKKNGLWGRYWTWWRHGFIIMNKKE